MAVVLRQGMVRPDGRALLVRDATDEVQELMRLDASVTTTDLSADGRTLLVTRVVDEQHDISAVDLATGTEVWRLAEPTEGRVLRELPAPGVLSWGSRVRWSPDGRQLAVVSGTQKMQGRLHLLDPNTGKIEPVITGSTAENVDDVRWEASGRWLYYRAGRTIRRIEPGGSAPQTVYTLPEGQIFGAGSGFDVSPRDLALVVTTTTPDFEECWVRVVDTQGRSQDRHRFPGECQAVVWTRDGERLVAANLRPAGSELWLLDRVAATPMKLPLESDGIFDLSLSPDGRGLLYSAGNPRPNMVILRGVNGAR